MHYRCTKCGYEEAEYYAEMHPCPKCGETVLLFHHFGSWNTPDHWVTIDTSTGKSIGVDLCETMHAP